MSTGDRFAQRRAATLADAVAAGAAVLAAFGVFSNTPNLITQQRKDSLCRSNLYAYSYALGACRAENNGFSPLWDDSNSVPPKVLFSWADLLADEGYVDVARQRCPSDMHPDVPAEDRGIWWAYNVIDHFGVGEPPRPGVRTSYAVNSVVAYNWAEDRFPDASRQIDVADGWWTFHANVSAFWSLAPYVCGVQPDIDAQGWQDTMLAYRHRNYGAYVLMLDGGVRQIVPTIPTSAFGLSKAVDTEQTCTWLPGERNFRYDNDAYRGTHVEWRNRRPQLYLAGNGGWTSNPGLPNHLKPAWRSQNNAWVTLPNPSERH